MSGLAAGLSRRVRHLGICHAPTTVRRYVVAVCVAAVAASTATAWLVPVSGTDLIRFGLLTLCAAASIELTRQIERQREFLRHEAIAYVDTKSVWSFAAVLVLPPILATAMVMVTYTLAWFRVWPSRRPVVLYRWVFAAATVLLGTQAAAAVLATGMHHYPGVPQAEWLAGLADLGVVLLAGALRWALNCGLVMTAIALSDPTKPVRELFTNFSQQLLEAGTMALGLVAAVVLLTHPVVLVAVVTTLVVMHRGVLLQQFQHAARSDAKTGLATVKWWRTVAEKALDRARGSTKMAGLLILDIDWFKRVNDTYGHLVGDQVLQAVATELIDEIRGNDTCCRWGGEELTVIVEDLADASDLVRVAERLRQRVEALRIRPTAQDGTASDETIRVTVSIGSALYPSDGITTLDELMMAADSAVYAAKAAGRNRVRLAGAAAPSTATDG